MHYHKHEKRNKRLVMTNVAFLLAHTFEELLKKIFGEGKVRVTTTPFDPVYRLNFFSRATCGYVLINPESETVSWKFYANMSEPEKSVPFSEWRVVVRQIACQGHFSWDQTIALLAVYSLDNQQ